MFEACAAKAKNLTNQVEEHGYIVSYTIKVGERKSVVIKAKSPKDAKLKFEKNYPTAKILNVLEC